MKPLLAILLFAAACGSGGEGEGEGAPDGAPGGADAAPTGDAAPQPENGPARYGASELRSPITPSVVSSMRAIYERSPEPNDGVFMKVGASGTVNNNFLDCFDGDSVDLDGRVALQSTIDDYRSPMAAGVSSWSRDTLAAEVGRTASWAIGGDPSPLQQEVAAIQPRIALVNYGTNDMQLGLTHETALWPFVENFSLLLDELEEQGIIPIITGLNPRSDDATAAEWVPTYNAVTRAIAEARQLPYINLFLASSELLDLGLLGDGLHGNASPDGACLFDDEGLGYNYNLRNLLTLEALDEVKQSVLDGQEPSTDSTIGYRGSGSAVDPIVVDGLPFTHSGDTSSSATSLIDSYEGCNASQNESGPEVYYRLELDAPTSLRILVLHRSDVDVDLHLLGGDAQPDSCIERDHRILETRLEAGSYHLTVDSFVDSQGAVLSGAYSLVVVPCEAGDPRC